MKYLWLRGNRARERERVSELCHLDHAYEDRKAVGKFAVMSQYRGADEGGKRKRRNIGSNWAHISRENNARGKTRKVVVCTT